MELEEKNRESQELSDLASIYSRKINKLQTSLKAVRDKDDESYIEITIPFAPL